MFLDIKDEVPLCDTRMFDTACFSSWKLKGINNDIYIRALVTKKVAASTFINYIQPSPIWSPKYL